MSAIYVNAEQTAWLVSQALENEKPADTLRRLLDGLRSPSSAPEPERPGRSYDDWRD